MNRCVFKPFTRKRGEREVGTPPYRYLFDAAPIYVDVEGGWTTPLPNDFSAYSCNWVINPKFGFATLLLLLI